MDDYTDIPEMQRSERSAVDLRGSTEQQGKLTADDLSLLFLDTAAAKYILEQYVQMNLPKESVYLFEEHLLKRVDSWFVKVGEVGIVYLTNIIPTFTAQLQVFFWDRKFGANRRELIRGILATAFEEFSLTKVSAFVPVTNKPMAEVELRKIGFVHEGVLRKAWRENGVDVDMVVFGLLREEANWTSVPHLVTEVV